MDATVGLGGHAERILQALGPTGRLIGLDQDPEALAAAKDRLERIGGVTLVQANFGEAAAVLDRLGVERIDAALLDLGVSSLQLDSACRGFSFQKAGPLDMRMDPAGPVTAAEIVNRADARELARIIRDYGEERFADRIARAITAGRPFTTTIALAETVRQAVPGPARFGRIHPATRTFQALRIAVNSELERLEGGIGQLLQRLRKGGRIVVLAYHSLEDRIVKNRFREESKAGRLELLTAKPIRPSEAEVAANRRARSARLRAARKVAEEGAG